MFVKSRLFFSLSLISDMDCSLLELLSNLIYNRLLSIYNNYYCSVIISIFHFIVGLFSTGDDHLLIESYKLNNLNDTFF